MGDDLDGRLKFDDSSGKYKLAKTDKLAQHQSQVEDK